MSLLYTHAGPVTTPARWEREIGSLGPRVETHEASHGQPESCRRRGRRGVTPLRQSRMVVLVSAEAIAIAGVGVALLAVLVPVVVLQSRRLEQRIDAIVEALASTRAELSEVRRVLRALAERVARIEGALTGPWRPTNGSPVAASTSPPEATAE